MNTSNPLNTWWCHAWATWQTSLAPADAPTEAIVAPERVETPEVIRDGEQGSVTMENVIWALAVIAIAAIVVAAITGYVTKQSGLIGQ